MLVLHVLPNFSKYADSFKPELDQLLPGRNSNISDYNDLWHTQAKRLDHDSDTDMWGLNGFRPDEIIYNGKSIEQSCSREKLWLRSDLCRLTDLIRVPTVDRCEIEKL